MSESAGNRVCRECQKKPEPPTAGKSTGGNGSRRGGYDTNKGG